MHGAKQGWRSICTPLLYNVQVQFPRQEEPRNAELVVSGNSMPEAASPSQNLSINSERTELQICEIPLLEGMERVNPSPETASPSQNFSINSKHTKLTYPESETLWYLSCSSRHKYLLRHPVVTSFLLLKWHKIRRYFYLNLAFFVLTVAMLTAYVLLWEQTTDPQIGLNILWYLLAIFVAILFLREFFQFGIAPMRYLCRIANYLEFGMIFNTAMILYYSHESESVRHHAAMAVICAYISLMLLLGRHPDCSLLIEAFTCVTRSFFKLLLWYSILIFGFALSFHLLFGNPITISSNTNSTASDDQGNKTASIHAFESFTMSSTTSKPEESKKNKFVTLTLTSLKMVAMMTGELDFNGLPFDMPHVISRVIFVVFVFLIPVVLMNLLNGLAVSDTHAIYSEAETFKYANLAELVSYSEAILLGDPFHFLSNYPTFSCVRRLPDANCCRKVLRISSLRPCLKLFNTLLFDRCLPDKAFTVYPIHRGSKASCKSAIDAPKCKCHGSFSLPDEIIEAACERLQAMHDAKKPADLAKEQEKKQATLSKTHELAIKHALEDKFDDLKQEIKSLSENQVEIMRLLKRA